MKKNGVTIRSSAAEYLTFVASTGDSGESIEIRYEDENIWLTQKMMAVLLKKLYRSIQEKEKDRARLVALTRDSTMGSGRSMENNTRACLWV